MNNLHNYIINHSHHYRHWHEHPRHRHHHWLVAIAAAIISASAMFGAWQASIDEISYFSISFVPSIARAQLIECEGPLPPPDECAPTSPTPSGRYVDPIFSHAKESNVVFSAPLALDIYFPSGDTATDRPLVIWIHGGGFTGGDKSSPSVTVFAEALAQRGYVVGAVNYRLRPGNNYNGDEPEFLCEVLPEAQSDVQAAIRWFLQHESSDREDDNTNPYILSFNPSKIVVAGGSAGAITALAVAYNEDYLDAQGLNSSNIHAGCPFEDVGGNPIANRTFIKNDNNPGLIPLTISAVSVSGALGDEYSGTQASWSVIDEGQMVSGDDPVIFFHGSLDTRVVYQNAINLKNRANEVGVPFEFHTFVGAGHSLITQSSYILAETVDFLYRHVVQAAGPPPNNPPTATWDVPRQNETVAGSPFLSVLASDTDGTVTGVDWCHIPGANSCTPSIIMAQVMGKWTYQWDTTTVANGLRTLCTEATDDQGTTSANTCIQVTVDNSGPIDNVLPSVGSFTLQARSDTDPAIFDWDVSDDQNLSQVELYRTPFHATDCNDTNKSGCAWAKEQAQTISGTLAKSTDIGNSPFTDIPPLGTYYYGLHAVDWAGNWNAEPNPPGPIKVIKTNALPIATWDVPQQNDTISGSRFLSVLASDTDGTVTGVNWCRIAGTGSCVPSEPLAEVLGKWTVQWNTFRDPDGTYTLCAEATDNDGGKGNECIQVDVDNGGLVPPSLTWSEPTDSGIIFGTANLVVESDATASTVGWCTTTAASCAPLTPMSQTGNLWNDIFDTTVVSDGSRRLCARATGLNGATNDQCITVTVSNGSGNQPPTVTWDVPQQNDTISGSRFLSVLASDTDGTVTGVNWCNTPGVGSCTPGIVMTEVLGKWTYQWDSSTVADGVYTLCAEATDNLGATGNDCIQIVVSNAVNQPPSNPDLQYLGPTP